MTRKLLTLPAAENPQTAENLNVNVCVCLCWVHVLVNADEAHLYMQIKSNVRKSYFKKRQTDILEKINTSTA